MNMHFRRALVPAAYQLPMHIEVMPDWVIDRYGDIWGGFILKTLMDMRGDRFTVGGPMIHHMKAGALERNMWQEHLAHLVNDEFVRLLQSVRERLAPAGYLTMMSHLREELLAEAPGSSAILRCYLRHLTNSLSAWVSALGTA
jgi:hypothetical protein